MKTKKIILTVIIIIAAAAAAVFAATKLMKAPAPAVTETEQAEQTEKPAEEQAEQTEEKKEDQKTEAETAPRTPDMLTDTSYRGTVKTVSADEITILLDGKDSYTFTLSDKARGDIEYFGVKEETRVIVTFEKSDSGVLTATSVDVVTEE